MKPSQALLGSNMLFSTLFDQSKYKGFEKAKGLSISEVLLSLSTLKEGLLGQAQTTRLSKPCGFRLLVCPGRTFTVLHDHAGTFPLLMNASVCPEWITPVLLSCILGRNMLPAAHV